MPFVARLLDQRAVHTHACSFCRQQYYDRTCECAPEENYATLMPGEIVLVIEVFDTGLLKHALVISRVGTCFISLQVCSEGFDVLEEL